MSQWENFWGLANESPLLAGTIATVAGGIILSLLPWGRKMGSKLGKALKQFLVWVPTLRIVTTAQIVKLRRDRIDEISRLRRSLRESESAIADRDSKVRDLSYRNIQLIGESAVAKSEKSRSAPTSEVQVEASQTRLPPPRWSVRRAFKDNGLRHVLVNYETSSVATNVRLDAPPDHFEFHDAARWDLLEHDDDSTYSRGDFAGRVKGEGRNKGVLFTVTWLDEFGEEKSVEAHLDRPPRTTPRVSVY